MSWEQDPHWFRVPFFCMLLAESLPNVAAHLITRPVYSCVWKCGGSHSVGVRNLAGISGACVLL